MVDKGKRGSLLRVLDKQSDIPILKDLLGIKLDFEGGYCSKNKGILLLMN